MKRTERLLALFFILTLALSLLCGTAFAVKTIVVPTNPSSAQGSSEPPPPSSSVPESVPAVVSPDPPPSSSSAAPPSSSQPVQSSSVPASSSRRAVSQNPEWSDAPESSSSGISGDFWGVSSEDLFSSAISLPDVGSVSGAGELIASGTEVTPEKNLNLIGIISWACIGLGVLVVILVLLSTTRRPPPGAGPGRKRYRRKPYHTKKKRLLNEKYYRNNKY